ncbi:MAG: type II toxin-antitoxin system RelE/ParE family toxin [Stenotrophobium sp.]
MTKPVIPRPCADTDIDEIFVYLWRHSPQAARKFLDAVAFAFDLLGEQPSIGSSRHAGYFPDLPRPLRFHPLKEFERILIYYVDDADCVDVIRIWDAARGLEALLLEADISSGNEPA